MATSLFNPYPQFPEPRPAAQTHDIVQVVRYGQGEVIDSKPYGSPGFPMGLLKIKFPDGAP